MSTNTFLFNNAFSRVWRNSALSINNATFTAITFNAAKFDPYSMWDSATKITMPNAGKYLVGAGIEMNGVAVGANGYLLLRILINATTSISETRVLQSTGANDIMGTSALYSFAAGDYIEAYVQHNYGAANNILGNAEYTYMYAVYVGQ